MSFPDCLLSIVCPSVCLYVHLYRGYDDLVNIAFLKSSSEPLMQSNPNLVQSIFLGEKRFKAVHVKGHTTIWGYILKHKFKIFDLIFCHLACLIIAVQKIVCWFVGIVSQVRDVAFFVLFGEHQLWHTSALPPSHPKCEINYINMQHNYVHTRHIYVSHVNIIISHINIIMMLINIIILRVDIIYIAWRGQNYATIDMRHSFWGHSNICHWPKHIYCLQLNGNGIDFDLV